MTYLSPGNTTMPYFHISRKYGMATTDTRKVAIFSGNMATMDIVEDAHESFLKFVGAQFQ